MPNPFTGGLTENQTSVGDAVNRIQRAQRAPRFRRIAAALFDAPRVAATGRTYDAFSGEGARAASGSAGSAKRAH